MMEKQDETTLETKENEPQPGENGEAKKDAESAGSGDAPTDIVQDSPGQETSNVAVMSEVQSPSASATSPVNEDSNKAAESAQSPTAVVEAKIETPCTETPKPPTEDVKLATDTASETKPEEPKAASPAEEKVAEEPKPEAIPEAKVSQAVVEEPKPACPVAEESKPKTSPMVEHPEASSPAEESKPEASTVSEQPKTEAVSPQEPEVLPVQETQPIASPVSEEPKSESNVPEEVPVVASPVLEKPKSPEETVSSPVSEGAKPEASPLVEDVQAVTSPVVEKVETPTEVSSSVGIAPEIPSPVGESKSESVDSKDEPSVPSPVASPETEVAKQVESPVEEKVTSAAEEKLPTPEDSKEAKPEEPIENVNGTALEEKASPVEQKPVEAQTNGTSEMNGENHQNEEILKTEQGNVEFPTLISWKNGGKQVAIAGDFNKWEDNCMLNEVDGVFSTKLKLAQGTHHLKYLVDGNWTVDESQPTIELEGHGQVNVLTVQAE